MGMVMDEEKGKSVMRFMVRNTAEDKKRNDCMIYRLHNLFGPPGETCKFSCVREVAHVNEGYVGFFLLFFSKVGCLFFYVLVLFDGDQNQHVQRFRGGVVWCGAAMF